MVLVIDDISSDVKSFLINMKIQSISREDILKLASLLEVEERMSVLKIVYEEFSREYKSDIWYLLKKQSMVTNTISKFKLKNLNQNICLR